MLQMIGILIFVIIICSSLLVTIMCETLVLANLEESKTDAFWKEFCNEHQRYAVIALLIAITFLVLGYLLF